MLITTEFRTHWIDSAGRCYAQCYPFRAGLAPVVNLDEVRAWLDLAASAFPGGEDGAAFGMRQVLERGAATDTHLAAATALELTDHVPRYQSAGADWRAPFFAMRERWPLPSLTGYPVELRNLTPHAVTIGEITIPPSGTIARATEESTRAEPLRILRQDVNGHPAVLVMASVPTSTTHYTGLVDLPDPDPGVYLIVSLVVMQVATSHGRWTGDLLVPGDRALDRARREGIEPIRDKIVIDDPDAPRAEVTNG